MQSNFNWNIEFNELVSRNARIFQHLKQTSKNPLNTFRAITVNLKVWDMQVLRRTVNLKVWDVNVLRSLWLSPFNALVLKNSTFNRHKSVKSRDWLQVSHKWSILDHTFITGYMLLNKVHLAATMYLQWTLEILLNKQDNFQKTLRIGIHISSLKKFKKEFCKSNQSSANFTTVFKVIVLKSKIPKALYNEQKWIQLNAKLLYMSVKTNAINYLHIKIQNRNFFFLIHLRINTSEFALFSTMSLLKTCA